MAAPRDKPRDYIGKRVTQKHDFAAKRKITRKYDDKFDANPYRAGPEDTEMKKIVVTFGLISGAIIGYTTIVLSALMIFFDVKSYRDNVAGGTISFGKAFQVGLFIALVSAVCYVVTWEFIYLKLMPDFWDNAS